MKTKSLLLGAIFVILGLCARGQVYEMYYQGFETSETTNYTVTPSSNSVLSTTYQVSGDMSLQLTQSSTDNVVFMTSPIDFTQNTSLRYIALEFDHICNLVTEEGHADVLCRVFVKRANQDDYSWVQLLGTEHYDKTETYSTSFAALSSFSMNAYPNEWKNGNNPAAFSNEIWKHERFNINNILTSSVPANERILVFKFEVSHRFSGSSPATRGWLLDNIRVRASQNPIIAPSIEMVLYPDGGAHPSSRGARVELAATTTLAQGIDPDSVYLVYKVGSDETEHRLYMTPYTQNSPVYGNRTVFSTRIPFEGFDTVMQFYCMVKDATSNHNERTFPKSAGAWIKYWCVRGTSRNYTPMPDGFTPTSSSEYFPFPMFADNRAEFVYDSAKLAAAGYGPGAITDLRFILDANITSAQARPKFQLRMKNVSTNHTVADVAGTSTPFTSDYMQVVYDSTYVIGIGSAGSERLIHLRDTFFYAGKDIVVQTIYDASTDFSQVKVKTMSTATGKKTLFYYGKEAAFGANAYIDDQMRTTMSREDKRPVFLITQHANQPLLYDMGVSALLDPNYNTPISSIPAQLHVQLKNFGALPVNGVRISYMIDDTISGHYDWTGTLAPEATTSVTIASGLMLPAGYHRLRAWTEDSVTAGGVLYRDHEPYNNSSKMNRPSDTSFIVCAGPLNGVRNIGGVNADYNDIEEFLFSLNRCGINDSLVVRLAPGAYPPFTMPEVTGLSAQNYIVFCPQNGAVVLYSDDTTGTESIVNLDSVANIRFRDITFSRRGGSLTNIVKLGMGSDNCRFERCTFVDSMENVPPSMRINAMLNSGFADNLLVRECTFQGGAVGVSLVGQAADIRSYGNRIENSLFRLQNNSAVQAQFQSNVTIKGNEMYDVLGNANYVLLVYACYDTVNVMANKLYTSHGAGAIGVSDVHGSAARHAFIANNMIVCDDDGTANLLTTPLNIIQGEWIDVVYNSVKMTAPERYSIAAATFGGGTGLSNCRFMNNIIASFDMVNYAFNYIPSASSNTIGHNIYYSEGYNLNRRSPGGSYTSLSAWQAAMPADSLSQSFNPLFLNGSLVDLRTFNRAVKGIGTPIAGITTDMFDTVRNATAPCPGAFEFVSLLYDFEPEAMLNPVNNCDMPDNVELVVRLRNSGVNAFTPGGSINLSLSYKVGTNATQTFPVSINVPGDDTISYHTGHMLQLPPNGIKDSTYCIKVWLTCPNDPNQTNDTNVFFVTSFYHEAAPDTVNVSVPYATPATVVPTSGITQWPLYEAAGGPTKRGNLYWYRSREDNAPFHYGDTLVTDTLRNDTIIYFQQRREAPVVRITQVQIKSTSAVGLTNPVPTWMQSGTTLSVQLTNVGDDTAFLQGDMLTAVAYAANGNPTTKSVTFGSNANNNVILAPGKSILVQFVGGNASVANQAYTVHTGQAISTTISSNVGIYYTKAGTIADAVALNGNSPWNNNTPPTYVWSGAPVTPSATAGGIYRVSFHGNAADWMQATAAHPMFIDSTDMQWMRYVDNGCPGDFGAAVVTLQAPPTADIALSPRPLPEGCNLGMEDVSVYVRNYGTQPVQNLTLKYNAGGATVTETLTAPVAAGGDTIYTFLQKLNMATPVDSVFSVRIWASGVSGDTYHINDTCVTGAIARFTPATPVRPAVENVPYATADTITIYPGAHMIPVWYDNNMNVVDTGYTHITELLYADENVSVGYLAVDTSVAYQVGTGVTVIGKTAYPSPYQPNNKHAKQQYIYSASELHAQGMVAGPITKVAFYLDSIYGTAESVTFDEFYISIGATSDTIFANTTAWKPASLVYSRAPYLLQRSDAHGWVTHIFDTPFIWDGVSSIVVQVAYDLTTAYTTGVQTRYTAKPNTTLHKNNNNPFATNAATIDFTGAGTKGNNRPNIQFGTDNLECNIGEVHFGCVSGLATTLLHLIGVPNTDAKIMWPEGSDSTVYNNCANISMNVDVRNLGLSTLNGFKLKYILDDQPIDSVIVTNTVVPGAITTPQLFSKPLDPGRHSVTAIVVADGDVVTSNDTIYRDFMVRFCGGTYTIAANSTTADYHSITEAIDTLMIVGVAGPVVFQVASGTYNEQLLLQPFFGSSTANTVTFRGETDSTVLITYPTAATANYVFKIDGASNIVIDKLRMVSAPANAAASSAAANILDIGNANNITLRNSTLRVPGNVNANSVNSNCIVLQGNVSNLTVDSCWLDSGYYAVKSNGTVYNYRNFTISNNRISGFWGRGIDLQGVVNIDISSNDIRSGIFTSLNGRGLVGVYLQQVDSSIFIQKNKIYLVDGKNGGKVGLFLKNVKGSAYQWGFIANNMISGVSIGNSGGAPCTTPSGMYLDDGCQYLNLYYNTMRASAGLQNNGNGIAAVHTLHIQGNTTHHIQVMNNIIANASKSYAYFVSANGNVTASDYNAYFSDGPNLAKWLTTDCATLAALQAANSKDANSLSDEPYFVADDDLHLIITNFNTKAQYNTDVIDDIDGTIRPQIPAPTIGAHEMERMSHNMSVVRILEPTMPALATKPNNIESDSIKVKVEFYNNGSSTETDVQWYAYLEGFEGTHFSVTRSLGTVYSNQKKTDSVMVPTQLGIIDTHIVHVVLLVNNDDDTSDNQLTAPVYLAPAFDLTAMNIRPASTECYLQNTAVTLTIKNTGFKDFPPGATITIGYHSEAHYQTGNFNNIGYNSNNLISVPTLPDTVMEVHTLTNGLDSNDITTITFDSLANFYPTGMDINMKVLLTGWVRYTYDVKLDNDHTTVPNSPNASSASPFFPSYYTPSAPVGRDTTFNYGTWGEVTATQVNSFTIRWFRDTTGALFYPVNASGNFNDNYNASRKWSTTPQYFHDSTYYLLCISKVNNNLACSSYFSPVHVHVAAQKPVDAAVEAVVAPLGGRVYSENDTVRVRIANYGTQNLTSIPITYELRKGNSNNVQQTVTETYSGILAPNQTYVFAFDSLLQLHDTTLGNNYKLRVWTNVDGDGERRNDTIRYIDELRTSNATNNLKLDYPFNTLPRNTYPAGQAGGESDAIDLIRFSYNEIDIDLPPLGRSYTDLGASLGNPDWPVLHVKRGTVDTMILTVVKPTDPNAIGRGKIAAYIDFNRNGTFADPGECVVMPQQAWFNTRMAFQVAIPNNASYGYMKLRVTASVTEASPTPDIAPGDGHMVDFLLFVDANPPASDLAVTQLVSPRSYLVRDDEPVNVALRIANKGTQTVNSAQIHYRFRTFDGNEMSVRTGDTLWEGNLPAGRSTIVRLPSFSFPLGTTKLMVWTTYPNDGNPHNDTLVYEYHRFHTITLTMFDNFDSLDHWYAPTGYNLYTQNLWGRGTPSNKADINTTYSEPYAWVTDVSGTMNYTHEINTRGRGNVSYLYSPIINIAQIRPDTISLMILRDFTNDSKVTVEFYNYANQWQKLDLDTLSQAVWYNNEEDHVFDGSSVGGAYQRKWISTRSFNSDFNEKLQFRVVYSAPQNSLTCGDGCAIDDFRIGRAPRRIDVGVVDIPYPTEPKYGQTIYPKVVVKNFGLDTARQLEIGYTHYGSYLAKISTFECRIPPSGTDTFQFTNPMTISSDYPDTFAIKAFTINTADLYRDNDSVEKDFALAPLDDDISAHSFVSPLDRVIAGDSVTVVFRFRNFGTSPISSASLSYIVNGVNRVDEDVNIEALLGRPLQSMEYFNYTFHQKYRAPMGLMNIVGIAKDDHNDYIYNDTIMKRVEGISSITDIAAASVVVDTSSYSVVKVQLVIDNRGARGANNFEVGFWYDNDTNTRFSEFFQHEEPLPALSTGSHTFSIELPTRPAPWNHFVGYVHIEDDNDPSNDTTTTISTQYVDVEVLGIIVEENAEPDCRVFLQMRNIGNLTLAGKTLCIRASVNGNDLSDNLIRTLEPGHVVTIEFSRRIPKDPMRHYEGTGRLINLAADRDPSNNQTTNVSVVNYFEGVPTVNAGHFVLDQNYPNPFSGQTVVPFSLPKAAMVRFFVMDAMGKMVNSFERFFQEGDNHVTLDMDSYSSGIYYYGIEVDGQRQMRKMILR